MLGRILVAPSSQRRLPGLDICTDWQLRGHGASARNLDTTGWPRILCTRWQVEWCKYHTRWPANIVNRVAVNYLQIAYRVTVKSHSNRHTNILQGDKMKKLQSVSRNRTRYRVTYNSFYSACCSDFYEAARCCDAPVSVTAARDFLSRARPGHCALRAPRREYVGLATQLQ